MPDPTGADRQRRYRDRQAGLLPPSGGFFMATLSSHDPASPHQAERFHRAKASGA